VKYKGDAEKDPGYPSMLLFIDARGYILEHVAYLKRSLFFLLRQKRKKIEKGKEKKVTNGTIFRSLLKFGGASPKILNCEARPRRITRRMDSTPYRYSCRVWNTLGCFQRQSRIRICMYVCTALLKTLL
jgi:hypothetical protein